MLFVVFEHFYSTILLKIFVMNWCLLLLNICVYIIPFVFIYLFFNWRIITLQYCDFFCHTSTWVSHRYTCVPFPSWTPFSPPSPPTHPSRLSQSIGFGFLASYITLPLAIYFIYGNVYVSMLFSQIIPPPSPTVSKSLFFMSVFPLLPCMKDGWYHLSRFHIYALIYDVCLSLSDLLHSV